MERGYANNSPAMLETAGGEQRPHGTIHGIGGPFRNREAAAKVEVLTLSETNKVIRDGGNPSAPKRVNKGDVDRIHGAKAFRRRI